MTRTIAAALWDVLLPLSALAGAVAIVLGIAFMEYLL